ncbi:MAG: TonB-dependent receptor [Bryobacteraceae bacterium]|nr:TonB-dependent receptor [Bryobacteraceae bacterium]
MIRTLLPIPLFVAVLAAQTSTGSVVVNVKDQSAAAVAGVSVSLREDATGLLAEQKTSDFGLARFVSVKPGAYTITVSADGFKRATRSNIVVNVGESVALDFALEVGAVTETVEVVGAAPLLQTERGELGQVIGGRQILELPLNGRNPIALATLSAGVTPGQNFGDGPLNLANLNINGGRGGATEILQDGAPSTVPENSPGTYATATLPSVERVQEFKVQTNSFSAEYGRTAGGVINVVVKAGTNDFHGSAYEFLRNSRLDANNFFLNRAGRKLGVFQRNQYGFTLGGPVWIPGLYNGRNKTFFFGGFEGLRQRSQATSQATIPTAAQLRGDFSNTLNAAGARVVIFDPTTTVAAAGGGFARTPFAGNIIPAQRIDAVAAKALGFYPTPNTPGTGPAQVNNHIAAGSSATDDDNFDVRLDHQITSAQNIYGRASYRDYRQVNPNFYGTIGQPGPEAIPRPGHSGALHHTYTLRPNLLSEFTYGYARLFTLRRSFSAGADVSQLLGLPSSITAISDRSGFPAFTIPGYGAIGESFRARFSLESHTIQEHLSWTRGRQTMKFGFQVRINRTNFYQGNFPAGQFVMSSGFTQGPDPTRASPSAGHPLATMLIGSAASGVLTHDTHLSTQSPYYAGFFQDDIKVTNNLTVNLGLRYEVEIPRSERYNRLSVFNPVVTNPLSVPGLGTLKGGLEFIGVNRDRQFSTDKNNIGPRFGFAWKGSRGMVLRGGYALFYPPSSMTAAGTLGGGGNAGFASTSPFLTTVDGGLTPFHRLSNPFPNGFSLPQGSSLGLRSFLGLDFQSNSMFDATPYVQQWNLNIQKELMAGMLLEVGYAGARGTNLSAVFGAPNQLRPEVLSQGNALLQQTPNPFSGIITNSASVLSRPTVTRGQLLRPFPQFGILTLEKAAIGNSVYHSVQARLDRRFRNGFNLLVSYTASKLIDDVSTSGTGLLPPYAYIQNYYDRKAERSLATYDVAQRMVFSGLYELPVGKGRLLGSGWGRLADALAGGWQVNGIAAFSGGFPLILTNTTNNSGSLNGMLGAGAPGNGIQRPNNNGRSAKKTGAVVDRLNAYFDSSVFSQPAPFTFGNTGRTLPDVRGPGLVNIDLSLFKNFRITERGAMVQVRAEAFNLSNTPQFGFPNTTFGTGAFGVVSGQANNPRQIQFGFRLQF